MVMSVNPGRYAGGIEPTDIDNLEYWYRADLGVTGTTEVTAWADQSGNGRDLGATNGPALEATGGPNSTPMLNATPENDMVVAGFSVALPIHLFFVIRVDTFANSDRIWTGIGTPELRLLAAGNIGQAGGSNLVSPAEDTWVLLQSGLLDSTADFLRLDDDAKVTGTDTGPTAVTDGIYLFTKDSGLDNGADISIAEHMMYSAEIVDEDLTNLVAYFNDRYSLF